MASGTAYVSNDAADYWALAPDGSVATSAFTFMRWLNDSTMVDHDRVQTTEREGGDGQDMGLAYIEHHTGRVVGAAYGRPELLAKSMGWALGAGTVTSVASTLPYTHELSPANQARLLSWEGAAPGQSVIEELVSSKVSEVQIRAEHGKPLHVQLTVLGGDSPHSRPVGSARTVSYETDEPFYFNTGSHQLGVGGAMAGDDGITRWVCTFTRGQDDAVFGVGFGRKAIPDTNRNATLELTRRYQSATQHAAILYGAGSVGAATVATGAFRTFMTNGLTGSALRSFQLDLPLLVFAPPTRNVLQVDGETVYEDLNGVAMKARAGGTHLVWAQVKNAQPTAIASGLL